jgi:ATP-dependent helicase/nuclease subunit B
LTDIDEKDIYLVENFVLEYGIKFYNWTSSKKYVNEYLRNVKKEAERIAAFNRVKESFAPAILNYISKASKDKSAGSYCLALYEFLIETGIPEKLEKITDEYMKSGNEEKADEYKQVWSYLVKTMDSIHDVFQDEQLNPDEFYKTFSAALEEFSIGIIPRHFDEITVGITGRGKMHGIKALYILGMNDGKFPATFIDEGILNDSDRRYLLQRGIELSEDTESRTFSENFNIYNVLSIPSEYLYLSYSTADNSGSALRPSFVIVKIKNIFTRLSVSFEDNYEENSDTLETIEIVLPTMIMEESANQLFKDKIYCSITRIEKFAKCPLSYFLEYGIKAKERKILEVTPADIGNITHMVLEYFPAYISDRNLSFDTIDKNKTIFLVNEIITDIFDKMKDEGKFEDNANARHIKTQIEQIAARASWLLVKQMRAGSFSVFGSEIEYGDGPNCKLPQINIQLDCNKELVINGKIDRVDTVEHNGEIYYKVVDYKTGKKEFSLDEFYEGTQIQLVGYMKAFSNLKMESDTKPAGFFYFKATNPFLNERGVNDTELELVADSKLKLNGRALSDIEILSLMDKDLIDKKSSDFLPVRIKNDGTISSVSSVMSLDEMIKLISDFTVVCEKIGDEMVQGHINSKPSDDACAFCDFSGICRVKQKGELESVRKTEVDE